MDIFRLTNRPSAIAAAGLHFTYPRDKRRAHQLVEEEPLLASEDCN